MSDLAAQRLSSKPIPLTPDSRFATSSASPSETSSASSARHNCCSCRSFSRRSSCCSFATCSVAPSTFPGVDYVDYVVPGIFLEAVLIGGMTTALALAQDLQAGMIDRFRSLPMARPAFLAGRTLADLCRNVLALLFIIGLGLLVGFRFHNTFGACLGGVALIILFGYAFTWVYATVGLAVKDPQTAQMAAILPMFVLFFASSPSSRWRQCPVGSSPSPGINRRRW